jgi:hypothetical protein
MPDGGVPGDRGPVDLTKLSETLLAGIKPPILRLLLALAMALLVGIALLGPGARRGWMIVVLAVVIIVLAVLACALEYTRMKLAYMTRVENQLKRELRDVVMQNQVLRRKLRAVGSNGEKGQRGAGTDQAAAGG